MEVVSMTPVGYVLFKVVAAFGRFFHIILRYFTQTELRYPHGITDQEFDEAYYKPLPPGYSFGYLQTNTVQRFYYRQSLQESAFYALNSQSEFFTYNEVSHVCKNYSPKNIMTVVSTNDTNESSFYRSFETADSMAIFICLKP
ncbi:Hypothetical predicted protein [Octopus vulgaris]|uniref:Uncharacterized protein n=1 Tax=Octopus vulgaris TaxID=6645 RepID=A0AA36BX94_OCTVU|nr:Hypothetical predicted protein [Octopus vulgaris]